MNLSIPAVVALFVVMPALSASPLPASKLVTTTDENSTLIRDIMAARPNRIKSVLDATDKFEIQIIYTQINRDAHNRPSFTQHSLGVNPRSYFNPASTVKLPLICLALEKLNRLNIVGLNKYTRLVITQEHGCNTAIARDSTAQSGYPSIAQMARKMLLVSDNESYSQMFELLGQKEINERLWKMGYQNALIIRRFSMCSWEDNRYTNPIAFYGGDGSLLYSQRSTYNPNAYANPFGRILKGVRYMNEAGVFVDGPFDYTYSNFLCLQDINDMMKSVIFPGAVAAEKEFDLSESDRRFMYKYLSMLPRESQHPDYASDTLWCDNYKKYLCFGDRYGYDRTITGSGVRIFNIVGRADGYLTDVAYIVDLEAKTEFLLSAMIYANDANVVRDGTYEYYTVGLPFLGELGRAMYDYEKSRPRAFMPDLSKFKIDYRSQDQQ